MARHATNPLTGRPLCGSMGAPYLGLTCLTCRRLLRAVSTRNAEYQSWSESEAVESRRYALRQLDEATS